MVDLKLEPAFDFGSGEYTALFEQSSATAFQNPVWLAAVSELLVPEYGAEMATVTGRDQASGELVLLIPLVRRVIRGITIIEAADFGTADYAAPVVHDDWADQLLARNDLSAEIIGLLGRHDILRVKSARAEHTSLWEALLGSKMDRAEFSSHAVTLATPYSEWRKEAFGKSHCKYLDRKTRKLDKSGNVAFELVSDPGEAETAIRDLARLRAGRFENDPIQQDIICSFYSRLALIGATSGFTRTYRYSLDGETMAIVFGTAHLGTYNYLLIGGDYDRFAKHSPGLLIYDRIMEDWLEAGGEVFDFTIGDEPFKAKFGTTPTAIYTVTKTASVAGKLALTAQSAKRGFNTIRQKIKVPPLAPAAPAPDKETA